LASTSSPASSRPIRRALLATAGALALASPTTLLLPSCDRASAAPSAASEATKPAAAKAPWAPSPELLSRAKSIVAGMDLKERAGQVIMAPAWGKEGVSREYSGYLRDLKPGAIVLFAYNVAESPKTVAAYLSALNAAAAAASPRAPAMVAVDNEGGTVFRFKGSLTRLPAAADVGASMGLGEIESLGRAVGGQLGALGVGLSLGPVVEAGKSAKFFAKGRFYSDKTEEAAKRSGAFLKGLQSTYLAATIKHFPTMTSDTDPHKGLPRVDLSLDRLESSLFVPFKENLDAAAIMVSHVVVEALDPSRPLTLSPKASALIKGQWGYWGCLITDDLTMGSLESVERPEKAAADAIASGEDMVMVTDSGLALRLRDAIVRAVSSGALAPARLEDACLRVVLMKLRFPGSARPGYAQLSRFMAEADALLTKAGL
jgi:beta-N-acetylhexosaminidase